jgi:hypothetical protein
VLSNNDIVSTDQNPRSHEPIMIQLIIAATLFAGSLAATEIGYAELLILFL